MERVLVTGATGFIGRHLCAALYEYNFFVRALVRSKSQGDNMLCGEAVLGDLAEGPLSDNFCEGIDTIFHLVGKAHALSEITQDESEYFRVNTEATQKLLVAAQRTGVRRFVYFSSVKAVSDGLSTPYGASKAAAEELVLYGGYVPEPVIIRPAMVYGNTEKGNLPKMIRAIDKGVFPPPPKINNKRSMVHVDDVVQAAWLAATDPNAVGKVLTVTDGYAYSTRQIYEWICESLGKPVPTWILPATVLKLMAVVGDGIGKVQGHRFLFNSDVLEKLVGSEEYDSSTLKALGFHAQRDLRSSMPEIVKYLQ